MKHTFFALALSLCLFGCESKPGITKEQFIGTWENLNIHATLKMDDGSDSLVIVNEGEWETKLFIKPIVSEFKADGSFTSAYYSPDGDLLNQGNGKWEIRNDSLVLAYDGFTFVYKVTFAADSARFESMLDFDQDGKSDDFYDSWQRKLSAD